MCLDERVSFIKEHRKEPWCQFLSPNPSSIDERWRDLAVSKLLYLVDSLLDFEKKMKTKVNKEQTLASVFNWIRKIGNGSSIDKKNLPSSIAYDMAKARIKKFKKSEPVERLYNINQYGSRFAALEMSKNFIPSDRSLESLGGYIPRSLLRLERFLGFRVL